MEQLFVHRPGFDSSAEDSETTRTALGGSWALPFGLILLVAVLFPGCGTDRSDTTRNVLAKTSDGWSLDEEDLSRRFGEVYPDYPYGSATAEEKRAFLENVANNEILVTLARSELGELSWPAKRRVLVDREQFLVNGMFQEFLGDFRVSPEDKAKVRSQFNREALLHRIVPTNDQVAEVCYQEVLAGTPFEEAYQKYGVQSDELRTNFDAGWVTADKLPLEMVSAVFLEGRGPGDVIPPTRTTKGIWIVQIIDFRDVTIDAKMERRIDTTVRFLCSRDTIEAHRDRLTEESGYETFPQNFPAVNRCFNAYWDSLSKEQPRANEKVYMSWRSPTWLLLPEHRDLPLYTFRGDTGTAYDFMEDLNSAHTLTWPSGADREKRSNEIRMRIRQLFLRKEAERRGLDQREDFLQFLQRTTDEAYLDDYFERVITPGVVVTPDEAIAEFEGHPERYRSGERVAFGYLAFRPEDREKADRFAARTAGVDYYDWKIEAQKLSASDTTVVYHRDTGMIELERPLRNAFLQPLLEIAKPMETGELTGVERVGDTGFVIVRCNYRRHEKVYPREVGLPMADGQVKRERADEKIESALAAAKKARGLVTFPDRISGPVAETGSSATGSSATGSPATGSSATGSSGR